MWVFGYGSLVWKVDFPFETKEIGYIKGYERRFYQHSTDHRGTVQNPGRVVTLIPSNNPESKVFGVAYKIKEEDQSFVIDHLDYREKDGYEKVSVVFHPQKSEVEPFSIIVYLASQQNPNFAGYADVKDIARQVVKSRGPSGANIDYVLNLADSMRKIAPNEDDSHLFDLEKAVLALSNS